MTAPIANDSQGTSSDNILVLTSDKKTIKIPKCLAVRSIKLKAMIKEKELYPDRFPNGVFRLTDIPSDHLRRIIAWCDFHRNDPPFDQHQNRPDNEVAPWDAELLSVNSQYRFDLMMSAKSMGVVGLRELIARVVGLSLQGKTADELRRMYENSM